MCSWELEGPLFPNCFCFQQLERDLPLPSFLITILLAGRSQHWQKSSLGLLMGFGEVILPQPDKGIMDFLPAHARSRTMTGQK